MIEYDDDFMMNLALSEYICLFVSSFNSQKYGGLRRDPFLKKIPKDSSFVRKRKPVYWDPRNDYQSEVVDLTDPNAWGDFEQAYEAPTGARERNKMLKKLVSVRTVCHGAKMFLLPEMCK